MADNRTTSYATALRHSRQASSVATRKFGGPSTAGNADPLNDRECGSFDRAYGGIDHARRDERDGLKRQVHLAPTGKQRETILSSLLPPER